MSAKCAAKQTHAFKSHSGLTTT